jgi:hypothetical protein
MACHNPGGMACCSVNVDGQKLFGLGLLHTCCARALPDELCKFTHACELVNTGLIDAAQLRMHIKSRC